MAHDTVEKNTKQSAPASVDATADGQQLLLRFRGRLDAATTPGLWDRTLATLQRHAPTQVRIDAAGVDACDGAGLALLLEVRLWGLEHDCPVRIDGLDERFARRLEVFDPKRFSGPRHLERKHFNVPEEVGRAAVYAWEDFHRQVAFLGELFVAMVAVLLRPWRFRWRDMFLAFERAGANAVGIVALLGFLFGLITTFSSAMPLREFGVEVYVADLAALALVRVLGPFITAIILAGRSGSAFAAEIGTMKINNEIDALVTMGLEPVRFLAVPRVLASILVTPLLAVVANIAGLVGSGLVMVSLGFTLVTYTQHVRSAIDAVDVFSGLVKCFVFGALVGGIGCLRGLQTETGPSAVGISTTRAVVSGIILTVLAEGVFAVLYHCMGI